MAEQDNSVERAKRLHDLIERLKAGRAIKRPDHAKSLREQVQDGASRFRAPRQAKRP